MTRALLIVGVAIAIFAAAGILLTRRLVDGAGPGWVPALTNAAGVTIRLSDKPIPVPVRAFVDLDGMPISLDALRGKVVLLNFWATWCGPCREEIPMLMALQHHYREHLAIVALSVDERAPSEVGDFGRELRMNFPIVMAGTDVREAFGGIAAVPSTFVVNRDGLIVQRHLGVLDPAITEHEVRALAGLPTDATVQTVNDTGQVLPANAAHATELPGVDLSGLSEAGKTHALQRLNTEPCPCGCGFTIAQCRIADPSCDISPVAAKKIVDEIR
jgi:thiol-disulfide isomerase/thioredoxin